MVCCNRIKLVVVEHHNISGDLFSEHSTLFFYMIGTVLSLDISYLRLEKRIMVDDIIVRFSLLPAITSCFIDF